MKSLAIVLIVVGLSAFPFVVRRSKYWKAAKGLEQLRADRKKERGYLDFSGLVYFGILVGVVVTLVIAFGVPALWHLLKPFLHRVTS